MSEEPWLPVAKPTPSALRWAKHKAAHLDTDAYDLYQDLAVLPIETIGYCQRTKAIKEFFYAMRNESLLDIVLNDMSCPIERAERKRKESKIRKNIVVTTYISHMLLDDDNNMLDAVIKPVTLANGYCSTCWDDNYGGHLPPNLTKPVGEIRW